MAFPNRRENYEFEKKKNKNRGNNKNVQNTKVHLLCVPERERERDAVDYVSIPMQQLSRMYVCVRVLSICQDNLAALRRK